MTHLELESLASDYLEERLEPASRGEVEKHLAACADCRELVADLGRVVELCRTAEQLEPAPWLVAKILRATVGHRQPTFQERLAAFWRPSLEPRVAYAVAMAVFSFSIIVSAAHINLRDLTFEDLNPRTWAYRASRSGHLLYARAEKYYYDLRVVYEIESRFRPRRSEPQGDEKAAPKPDAPPGGSSHSRQPGNPQLASVWYVLKAGTGRSPSP